MLNWKLNPIMVAANNPSKSECKNFKYIVSIDIINNFKWSILYFSIISI